MADVVKKDTVAEKRLKTIEKSIKELIAKYAKLDKDVTEHVVTADAHNSAMLARKKQLGK